MQQIRQTTMMPLQGLRLLPSGIGILLAVEMIRLWPDLATTFGTAGLLHPDIARYWHSGTGWSIRELLSHAPLFTLEHYAGLYILLCLLMLWPAAVRIAAALLLPLNQAFYLSDTSWAYGVDYLAQTGLLITVFFYPSHKTSKRYARLGIIVLQGQLVIVYFFGGLAKLLGPTWHNGEALWKAIQQPFPGHLLGIPAVMAQYGFVWITGGLFVVFIELSYILAWLGKRYRTPILIATILLHLGIAIFVGLYHFAALMIWYNLCAWHFPFKTTNKILTPLGAEPLEVKQASSPVTDPIQGKEVD